jgi:hypothetical protein
MLSQLMKDCKGLAGLTEARVPVVRIARDDAVRNPGTIAGRRRPRAPDWPRTTGFA